LVIFREKGEIKICNDGRGIPVRKWAQDESIYIPTLIFGRLLTSDNFNDDQKRITGIILKTHTISPIKTPALFFRNYESFVYF